MARVVHFEFPVDDPDRAIEFYTRVFGWEVNKCDGPVDHWLIRTGEGQGIDGGFYRRTSGAVVSNTIGVPDIDDAINRIKANGGEILGSKNPIPGVGWIANFKDTEGNALSILQHDPEAK
jgi:predicted enzyme related to lactoylglutathione lyase